MSTPVRLNKVLKELNIKIEKDINENYVSALSDDLNHTVLKITGNKNIEILQTNASESDQANFFNLINKYCLLYTSDAADE